MRFFVKMGLRAFAYLLGLPTEGLRIVQRNHFDPETHAVVRVGLEIQVPPGFPEKYREAVVRAADQCAVKRTLLEPPEIEVRAV